MMVLLNNLCNKKAHIFSTWREWTKIYLKKYYLQCDIFRLGNFFII